MLLIGYISVCIYRLQSKYASEEHEASDMEEIPLDIHTNRNFLFDYMSSWIIPLIVLAILLTFNYGATAVVLIITYIIS
jgi:hypothetical protein